MVIKIPLNEKIPFIIQLSGTKADFLKKETIVPLIMTQQIRIPNIPFLFNAVVFCNHFSKSNILRKKFGLYLQNIAQIFLFLFCFDIK